MTVVEPSGEGQEGRELGGERESVLEVRGGEERDRTV